MAYIVADPCVKCKYTDCVAVCPVDCFYEGKNMLVIHPDECIDCGACEPECPTTAIFEEADLPERWEVYTYINAWFSGAAIEGDKPPPKSETDQWPEQLVEGVDNAPWANIVEQKDPLPDADAAAKEDDKLDQMSSESA